MEKMKNLLVCVDLSEMDEVLMKYASMVSKLLNSEKIFFLHAMDSDRFSIEEKEGLKSQIEENTKKFFVGNPTIEQHIELKVQPCAEDFSKVVENNDIDLVIVGRKLNKGGNCTTPKELLKEVECSTLFVPNSAVADINKIIVPVDFSGESEHDIELGIDFAKKNNAEIIFNNVYTVPSGYSSLGKSYEEYAEIMKKNTHLAFAKFITKFDLTGIKHSSVYTLDDDKKPADKIYAAAKREKADIIIIDSKGKSFVASILLGSVTDELTEFDNEIPLLILKDEEESVGFLEALFRI